MPLTPVPRTALYFGFNAPFIDKGGRVLGRQEDERLIKNDVLQLVMTVPTERIMRPTYGVNLRNFPFEPGDKLSVTELRSEIMDKIQANEPRVILKDVTVTASPDQNFAQVKIICALIKSPLVDLSIELRIPLGGQA